MFPRGYNLDFVENCLSVSITLIEEIRLLHNLYDNILNYWL